MKSSQLDSVNSDLSHGGCCRGHGRCVKRGGVRSGLLSKKVSWHRVHHRLEQRRAVDTAKEAVISLPSSQTSRSLWTSSIAVVKTEISGSQSQSFRFW